MAQVIWDIDPLLRCDFQSLFSLRTDRIRVKNRQIGSLNKYPYRIFDKLFYKEIGVAESVPGTGWRRLSTCHNFYDAHDYDFLSPCKIIENRVNELIPKEKEITGVQIRRTDNANSIEWSPTELFIRIMQEELEKNPGALFYLATDDIPTRDQLIHLFGDKVFYNPISDIRRDTKDGVINAAIDLYALSMCKKIYGSYYSSFSEVASDIGKKELIVVSKV